MLRLADSETVALFQAGNKVSLHYEPTAYHGSWSFPLPTGNKYKKETLNFIKDRLL